MSDNTRQKPSEDGAANDLSVPKDGCSKETHKPSARVLRPEDMEDLRRRYGGKSDTNKPRRLDILLGSTANPFVKAGETQHWHSSGPVELILRSLTETNDEALLRAAFAIRAQQKQHSRMPDGKAKESLRRWLVEVEHEFAYELMLHGQFARTWSHDMLSRLGLPRDGLPPEGLAVRILKVAPPSGRTTATHRARVEFLR